MKQNENKIPELKDYITKRDWVGAVAFLENEKSFSHMKAENNQWLAYAYFHNGDYK
jgi:intraflagellar transport protein 56